MVDFDPYPLTCQDKLSYLHGEILTHGHDFRAIWQLITVTAGYLCLYQSFCAQGPEVAQLHQDVF